MTTLAAAVVCFAGFGWGMVWHFRRIGPPTKTMLCVALAALVSAGLNLTALGRKPFWHPTAALALYAAALGCSGGRSRYPEANLPHVDRAAFPGRS